MQELDVPDESFSLIKKTEQELVQAFRGVGPERRKSIVELASQGVEFSEQDEEPSSSNRWAAPVTKLADRSNWIYETRRLSRNRCKKPMADGRVNLSSRRRKPSALEANPHLEVASPELEVWLAKVRGFYVV